MGNKGTDRKSALLTAAQLKRKLNDLTKDEIVDLLIETVTANKEYQMFLSLRLQGENAILDFLEDCKAAIDKQFYPTKGLSKLKVYVVERVFSDMKSADKGKLYFFELMVYFCEVAVRYIHHSGDILEDMGDLFTDTYETVIEFLNKGKSPGLYDKYKDRVKAIVDTEGCECWGIHDSLKGSYSTLQWAEFEEEEVQYPDEPGVVSYKAMRKWLQMPESVRRDFTRNVWCGRCKDVVVIRDFTVQPDKHGIVLEGSCSTCGNNVARFIED